MYTLKFLALLGAHYILYVSGLRVKKNISSYFLEISSISSPSPPPPARLLSCDQQVILHVGYLRDGLSDIFRKIYLALLIQRNSYKTVLWQHYREILNSCEFLLIFTRNSFVGGCTDLFGTLFSWKNSLNAFRSEKQLQKRTLATLWGNLGFVRISIVFYEKQLCGCTD